MTKTCRKCRTDKDLSHFYKRSDSKLGVSGICIPCDRADVKIRTEKNKEKRLAYNMEYHYRNREQVLSVMRERRTRNVEKYKQNCREWYYSNKEYALKCRAEYIKNNREKISIAAKLYRENNIDKIKARTKKYRQENSDKVNARISRRRYNQMHRTPKWLAQNDFNLIAEFYTKARDLSISTGIKHHVDHIVPLQGKEVSGLHVPWNLQILTAEENIKKSNTFKEAI